MPPYTHLGGYIAKVDGRTEYQSVGPGNLFQNGSQCILELADVRCFVFEFADHTGYTALIVHLIQADCFDLNVGID